MEQSCVTVTLRILANRRWSLLQRRLGRLFTAFIPLTHVAKSRTSKLFLSRHIATFTPSRRAIRLSRQSNGRERVIDNAPTSQAAP